MDQTHCLQSNSQGASSPQAKEGLASPHPTMACEEEAEECASQGSGGHEALAADEMQASEQEESTPTKHRHRKLKGERRPSAAKQTIAMQQQNTVVSENTGGRGDGDPGGTDVGNLNQDHG